MRTPQELERGLAAPETLGLETRVAIREEAREIAFAVLDEWYPTAPESARRLRRVLGQ